jgi:hypothetical protein
VPELMQRFGCSERNALRIVRMSASTYRYKPCKRDESALKLRIKEITNTRVHYGYPPLPGQRDRASTRTRNSTSGVDGPLSMCP